ncbi:MAG: hypothetical protein CL484_15055 [Acidobacteria bacterium]|nr:hypothetical protein [Acidobacteriota bacterium]
MVTHVFKSPEDQVETGQVAKIRDRVWQYHRGKPAEGLVPPCMRLGLLFEFKPALDTEGVIACNAVNYNGATD